MKHRKLRIAWSVAWGIVAVLLIGLWVRSYSSRDELQGRTSIDRGFELYSLWGRVEWYDWYLHRDNQFPLDIVSYSGDKFPTFIYPAKSKWLDFHCLSQSQYFIVAAPHWFFILLAATMSAAPWLRQLRWRFSLRTLLVAMTLVAVGLGLIVWLAR